MKNLIKYYDDLASEYDDVIKKIVPGYDKFLKAIVDIPEFELGQCVNILDLGCGTGSLAKAFKEKYVYCTVDGIDVSSEMIKLAQKKNLMAGGINFENKAVCEFDFSAKYDVVVASLFFQCFKSDEEKGSVYKRIFDCLQKGGEFLNFIPVLGCSERVEKYFLESWKEFLIQSECFKKDGNWLADYHEDEYPSTLEAELYMLRGAGFKRIDLIEKENNFALFYAQK